MAEANSSLISMWANRARESQFAHYVAARGYERLNYFIGAPVIALSTLVGTSVFATLGKSVDPLVQIFIGLTSVAAAVLASIQTFLKFSERAESHRTVAARYGSIRRQIEQHLAQVENQGQDSITKEEISSLREQLDELAADAPNISAGAWNKSKTMREEA